MDRSVGGRDASRNGLFPTGFYLENKTAHKGTEHMQVLHSLWDTEIFNIWSQSSCLPPEIGAQNKRHRKPLPHPFALTGTELKRNLPGLSCLMAAV